MNSFTADPLRVVVLISGNGSNLQAILEAQANGLPIQVVSVISNRANAFGLERARRFGVPQEVLPHSTYATREAFDAALAQRIDRYHPECVALAGFMRILTERFVLRYRGRLVNIHPSLLPDYPGLNTHERALSDKRQIHGASVHYVTPELDSGPVIMQVSVPVLPNDDAEQLAARVLEQEHRLYPRVLELFAQGRIELCAGRVRLDGRLLDHPPLIDEYPY